MLGMQTRGILPTLILVTNSAHVVLLPFHFTGVTIRFDSYKDAEEQMLHVLEIETNSPAELAGLVPFKDYLLGTAEKVYYTFFVSA